MDKIFSPIKERLLLYIDNKRITKENFYAETGISASNFKGKGAQSELGGEKIVKIITIYSDLNPDWLLTGRGNMIRYEKDNTIADQNIQSNPILPNEKIEYLEKINCLYETIANLQKKVIDILEENQRLKENEIHDNDNVDNLGMYQKMAEELLSKLQERKKKSNSA